MTLRCLPATPSRWPHVEELFGERGACGGCWCMFWRRTRQEFEAGKGAGNKRAFKRLIASGHKPGVLAYDGRTPVGWCAVAPRKDYTYLERSRIFKPVDEEPVWSISCLFVRRDRRRQGVSVQLIRAAAELAAKRGARIVEAYPHDPTEGGAPDAFVWNGITSAYRRAGFREVARRSPHRPIMRKRVG